jgi:hypothetical protein
MRIEAEADTIAGRLERMMSGPARLVGLVKAGILVLTMILMLALELSIALRGIAVIWGR